MTINHADRGVGARAHKQNPELLRLAFLIGEWSTTGTHPAAPGNVLPGVTVFEWAEGGAFLRMRSQTDHKDFPDGLALFASDNALRTITLCWFDERGISRLCPVTVGQRTVSWRHDDPGFMQRLTITVDADGHHMTSKGEMKKAGEDWSEDLSQVFTRR